jgi:hypothetical protein
MRAVLPHAALAVALGSGFSSAFAYHQLAILSWTGLMTRRLAAILVRTSSTRAA